MNLNVHHGGSQIYFEKEVGVFGEILFVKTKDNTEKKVRFFDFLCRDYKPTLLKNKNV